MVLENKTLIVIVTGGVGAYKACLVVRGLKKLGASVHCVLTTAAQAFVSPLLFESLTGNRVLEDLFERKKGFAPMPHISYERKGDLILVVPGTANFLSRLATGAAEDLAAALCLARHCPLVVAPAMNKNMWHSKATQRNVNTLKKDGVLFCGPCTGEQACGEVGDGRLADTQDIIDAVCRTLKPTRLSGKKIVITAGPTREHIDTIRFLSNASSGKQGYAIAQKCQEAGADVTLISGPTSLPPPPLLNTISVTSVYDMLDASLNALPADVFIATAAVSDYTPTAYQNGKPDKNSQHAIFLSQTPDILHTVATAQNRPPLVIGFALSNAEKAQRKRLQKQCDWMVNNPLQNGFPLGSDFNQIRLLKDNLTIPKLGEKKLKTLIAQELVEEIAHALENQQLRTIIPFQQKRSSCPNQ